MVDVKCKHRRRASNMMRIVRCATLALAGGIIGASIASADSQSPFARKTITILVGTPVGGGPDATARLMATYLTKYLPGRPTVIVQNMPGGNQIIAANYLERRAEPDGLTLMAGSSSLVDPIVFQNANVQYDPKRLRLIGGVGRCGSIIFIRKEAEPRLTIRPWRRS